MTNDSPDLQATQHSESEPGIGMPGAAAVLTAAAITENPLSHSHVFNVLSKQNTPLVERDDIDIVLEVPVQLTVELGRAKTAVKTLLQFVQGTIVELDGLAGSPMDVLVNGCLIAQGEIVVVNDKFGIRLTDITSPAERIKKLR